MRRTGPRGSLGPVRYPDGPESWPPGPCDLSGMRSEPPRLVPGGSGAALWTLRASVSAELSTEAEGPAPRASFVRRPTPWPMGTRNVRENPEKLKATLGISRKKSPTLAITKTWTPLLDPHDMSWRAASVKARGKLEMPPEITPWQDTKPSLSGVPKHERYPILLDICYYDFLKKEAKGKASRAPNGMPRWFCDLSQGPDRGHWGSTPPGLVQNTAIYSFEDDITFLESWGHRILGFPRVDLASLSKSAIKSLVGESVDLPSQAIILYAIYLTPTAPWWKTQKATSSSSSSCSQILATPTPQGPSSKRRKLPETFDLMHIDD